MRFTPVLTSLSIGAVMSAAPAFAEGDPVQGEIKVETCIGCHGVEGYSNVYPSYKVPKLAGQHAARIVAALQAYKSGERVHPTMSAQAGSLSDQDIEDIAAYLASLNNN